MPEFNDRRGNAGTGNGVVRQIGYSTIRGVKHTFTPNEDGGWNITHPHDPSTFVFKGVTDLNEAKQAARNTVLAPDLVEANKPGHTEHSWGEGKAIDDNTVVQKCMGKNCPAEQHMVKVGDSWFDHPALNKVYPEGTK
jgi:hypothetical protein